MPPTDLLAALRRKPFEPFRVVTSDGTTYDIRHPDLVIVGLGSAYIGYPDPHTGLAARVDIVATRHIIRLEQLEQPAASSSQP